MNTVDEAIFLLSHEKVVEEAIMKGFYMEYYKNQNGEKDDKCKLFDKQKNLLIICNYKNNILEGEYKEFYKGKIKKICYYINGEIYSDGYLDDHYVFMKGHFSVQITSKKQKDILIKQNPNAYWSTKEYETNI